MLSDVKCRKKTETKKTFPMNIISESKSYGIIDYDKFSIVEESLYSSVRPYHFLQIGKILKRMFKNPKFIVDACAHIGGSTINLAAIFPTAKFISIEIQKTVFNKLQENILAFGFQKRIMPVNENCIPFLKKLSNINRNKPDFINIDPPWGGPSYTRIKKLMLNLENTTGRSIPIYDIVNDIFSRDSTDFITFKAPNNFDMDLFKKKVDKSMGVYPIYNKPPKERFKKTLSESKRRTVYYYIIIKK